MNDSELFPRQRCLEIFDIAQRCAQRAGVRNIEVATGANREALTRFANNYIHQNVAEHIHAVSVRVVENQRTARATTNRIDEDGIAAAVEQAIALTRAAEPDEELLPLYAAPDSADTMRYSDAAARATPSARARAVAEAIRIVEAAGQTAAGIYSTGDSVEAILNSTGLFRYHAETSTQFSITAMAADSSGWAKASSPAHEDVDSAALAASAARKAALSANPTHADPGRYTVIFEPAAVLDFVGQMFQDFGATAVHDQRSFLTGRIGEPLFGRNITIHDQVMHPLQSGAAFDGEGVARAPLLLVDAGVPREIAASRLAAKRAGVEPTGHGLPVPNEAGEMPVNIVIAGEDRTLEDLLRSTANGILVTRLWYIREVEPFEKVMTGMTRDGTFLIRDGEIGRGLRNFRFNASIVEVLRNVEAMTRERRASGEEAFDMVVPGMKVHDFPFTEVTKF